ncbi:FMN-linked oxidoreductase [Mycena olivaceomarginata]|nr:FMN-linked oxidoreductase [Mycena olivaceomarginata]
MSFSTPKLFAPITVGTAALQHRVVLAPLTRYKASETHVPYLPLPGSLLITEATFIAPQAGGYAHVPGIWSPDQITAWKSVTDAVHVKVRSPFVPYVSASDVPLTGRSGPLRALTMTEIKEYVELYAQAAKNAVEAGFDGVEVHGANGYLVISSCRIVSNKRTDEYGGSVANRARFALEVVDGIAAAIGAERTAIRLSPWSSFQDGHGRSTPHLFPTSSQSLQRATPPSRTLHLVEPRVNGNVPREPGEHESNDVFRALWAPRRFVRAGGFTRGDALEAGEEGDLVAFGRFYISNPDLPTRLERDIPLTAYDRTIPRGYTDYPFATVAAA